MDINSITDPLWLNVCYLIIAIAIIFSLKMDFIVSFILLFPLQKLVLSTIMENYAFKVVHIFILIAAIISLVSFSNLISNKRIRNFIWPKLRTQTIIICFFWGINVISTIFSPDFSSSFAKLIKLSLIIIAYFVFISTRYQNIEKIYAQLWTGSIISSIFVCAPIYKLVAEGGIVGLVSRVLVEMNLTGESIRGEFNVFFGGGVNLMASWLGIMIIFQLISLVNRPSKKLYTVIAIILIINNLIVIGLTNSRTNQLAITFALLFFVIEALKSNKLFIKRKRSILLSFILLFAASLILFISNQDIFNTFFIRLSKTGTLADAPIEDRFSIWNKGLQLFSERPLLGYGPGNRIGMDIAKEAGGDNFHNVFIQQLADAGVFGFISYTCFLLACVYYFIKNKEGLIGGISLYAFILPQLFSQYNGADLDIFFIIAILSCISWNSIVNKVKIDIQGTKKDLSLMHI